MINFYENYILIILVDLYASLSRLIFCYPDPDHRLQKWIRIQTRPNDTDPTGSETLTFLWSGVDLPAPHCCQQNTKNNILWLLATFHFQALFRITQVLVVVGSIAWVDFAYNFAYPPKA